MNDLIEAHLGYAHAIAANLARKYPPNITRADLRAAAELGLVQAARSYDPSRSASFTTFAYYRVRGAIFDEVRKTWQLSHLGSGREKHGAEEINVSLCVGATDGPEPLEASISKMRIGSPSSFDLINIESVPDSKESPADRLMKKEESEALLKAIGKLPDRHRFVLRAYYYEDLSMVSIGQELSLSKSWVSRIHAQALAMVRNILESSPLRNERKKLISTRHRRSPARQRATL